MRKRVYISSYFYYSTNVLVCQCSIERKNVLFFVYIHNKINIIIPLFKDIFKHNKFVITIFAVIVV